MSSTERSRNQNGTSPIAVLGLGCRFAGDARSPERYWDMIIEGKNGWTEVPEDRFRWKAFYHPSNQAPSAISHRGGHFLAQDISAFDAKFFGGIGVDEAATMDPCQRLLLELSYEALENAGIRQDQIQGTNCSVHVATFTHDYARMLARDPLNTRRETVTGIGQALLANRISYVFDLKGASVVVDTACSGSMVALHTACQTLRLGEARMALVGASNLILDPDVMIPMGMANFLNSQGRSFSFDAQGEGYGRGEGIAVMVLKRLDEALRDGDPIRAVIRDTMLGQDGKTAGITLPNANAQAELVSSAYRRAHLDPKDTLYVEAHGTGTFSGDYAEVSALSRHFGHSSSPVYVGSVKANIGHTESVSGLAGVIKAVLAVEKGVIPPNPKISQLRPDMLPYDGSVIIPQSAKPWRLGSPHRASINSFGYGGSNGHCILEALQSFLTFSDNSLYRPFLEYIPLHDSITSNHHEANSDFQHTNGYHVNGHDTGLSSATDDTNITSNDLDVYVNGDLFGGLPEQNPQGHLLLPVSARSRVSLEHSVSNIETWIGTGDNAERLGELAHTLSTKRSPMSWRRAFIQSVGKADKTATLASNLTNLTQTMTRHKIFYVFTGQGAQWFAMGRELLTSSSVFRSSVLRHARILKSFGASWHLVDELLRDNTSSLLNDSKIGQPASTAIQLALVDLLTSLGVSPTAVVGHSSGEIAAAYAAGFIDTKTALHVSYHRGYLAAKCFDILKRKGAMLAIGLGEADMTAFIQQHNHERVVIACVNSPSSITVSGDEDAIAVLETELNQSSISVRRLHVDTAYHSHHMNAVADHYLSRLGTITEIPDNEKTCLFFSSVTGAEKKDGFGPSYWVQNLVSKVSFQQAIEALSRHCVDAEKSAQTSIVFLEIGAHHALAGPVRDTYTLFGDRNSGIPSSATFLTMLKRNKDAVLTTLEMAAHLFELGHNINISAVNRLMPIQTKLHHVQDLAPYPWDHSVKYWYEPRLSKEYRFRSHPAHDLLGIRMIGTSNTYPTWRYKISTEACPWLLEHVVDGTAILPASSYIVMALEGKRQISIDRGIKGLIQHFRIKDLLITKPVHIQEDSNDIEIQLSLRPARRTTSKEPLTWESFMISSVTTDGLWHDHCSGLISVDLLRGDASSQAAQQLEMEMRNKEELVRFRLLQDRQMPVTDGKTLYEQMGLRGNSYGPLFSTIQDFAMVSSDSVCNFNVPDIAKTMPAQVMQPHIIHPAPLDTIIHTCIPLFAAQSTRTSVVTHSIGEIVISAQGLGPVDTRIDVATSLSCLGPSSAEVRIAAFRAKPDGDSELVVLMKKGELKATVSASDDETDLSSEDQVFTLQWQRDPELCLPQCYPFQKFSGAAPEAEILYWNQMSSWYVQACISQIDPGKVVDRHRDFYQWLQKYASSSECHEYLAGLSTTDIQRLEAGAIQDTAVTFAISKFGMSLQPLLLDGDLGLLSVIDDSGISFDYSVDENTLRCNTWLLQFMRDLAFTKPNLKILEIGAGTGGATIPLLEGLGTEWYTSIQQYDFTDISTGFFERIRPKISTLASCVQYKLLDININPIDQGFQENYYDIVLAYNSLHVASDLDVALRNVRRLLKTGGRLILIETTNFSPYLTLMYGSLEGWFAGVNDGRQDSPLLDVPDWKTRLQRNSFDGLEHYIQDYPDSTAQRYSLMVSRAIDEASDLRSPISNPIQILRISSWSSEHTSYITSLSVQLEQAGLNVSVSELADLGFDEDVIYVLIDDRFSPMLSSISAAEFSKISLLLSQADARLLWVNVVHSTLSQRQYDRGYGLALGLLRTARVENPSLKAVSLDMGGEITGVESLQPLLQRIILRSFTSPDEQYKEHDISYIDGHLQVARLRPAVSVNTGMQRAAGQTSLQLERFHQKDRPLKLHVENPGMLDSICFIDDTAALEPLADHDIEIQTEACGVNFKDIMIAMGQLPENTPMAGECAGVVTAVGQEFEHKFKIGDRVFGGMGRPYASRARINGHCAYPIPSNLTTLEGATILVVFFTAYYGLIECARLSPGQKVLIHAAAGGVGQAALQIANHVGAEIFVTVGSTTKKQFIMDTFGITADHIFSSRDGSFKPGILRFTEGRGIDVVLNSLSGDLLQDSLDCLANFGSFIEIGKYDIMAKHALNLNPFERCLSFFAIDASYNAIHRPDTFSKIMVHVLKLFEIGALKPITPLNVMSLSQIEEAFRLFQTGQQMGKTVLDAGDSVMVKTLSKPLDNPKLSETGIYVIAGGLGGVGLAIGRLLSARGAKHIALLSRRTLSSDESTTLHVEFEAMGTQVIIIQVDIGVAESVQLLKTRFQSLPPVVGIFQCAMVTENELLGNMSLEQFLAATRPKAQGTENLMNALATDSLEFCIMLSSSTGLFGARGAANYAAGNSALDAMALDAPQQDTRYTSIVLGPMKDVGILARDQKLQNKYYKNRGLIPWSMDELCTLLDHLFRSYSTDSSPSILVTGFSARSLSSAPEGAISVNPLYGSLLTTRFANNVTSATHPEQTSSSSAIRASIEATGNIDEVQAIIQSHVVKKLSSFTSIDVDAIDAATSIADYALDSLVAIEFKNWISKTFKAAIQVNDVTEAPDLASLITTIVQRSTLVQLVGTQDISCEQNGKKLQHTSKKPLPDSTIQKNPLLKQPVPDLNESVCKYLAIIAAICSPIELQTTTKRLQEFGLGIGQTLHARAMQLFNNPSCDNWVSTKYLDNHWLSERQPLYNYSSWHSSYLVQKDVFKSTTIAAFVVAEALNLMMSIENNQVQPETTLERNIDLEPLSYLFGSNREPHQFKDMARRYPRPRHCIILRNGHIFQLNVENMDSEVDFHTIEAIIEQVLERSPESGSGISLLTADDRDTWSTNRQTVMNLSESNAQNLHAIESSAFILCLDTVRPDGPNNRAKNALFGDAGRNRWYDKSLQFVVCEDGTVSFVLEHSGIDGEALSSLRSALSRPSPTFASSPLSTAKHHQLSLVELHFDLDSKLLSRLPAITAATSTFADEYTFGACTLPYGRDFWLSQSTSPRTALELVCQLANRDYFGYIPSGAGTVSLAAFKGGRVAKFQLASSPTIAFCDYVACSQDLDANKVAQREARSLFNAAIVAHNKAVARAAKGLDPTYALKYFEWFLEPTDERPAIFDDPVYLRQHRDRVFCSDTSDSDAVECGIAPEMDASIWTHFQTKDSHVLSCTWARKPSHADAWIKCFERAAEKIATLLENTKLGA